jgi:hypothetical protein
MSDQNTGTPDYDALEERIVELENHVKEIGHVVYELVRELRAQPGMIDALPEPTCPPFCPRS